MRFAYASGFGLLLRVGAALCAISREQVDGHNPTGSDGAQAWRP
jgi:hypothetical protein